MLTLSYGGIGQFGMLYFSSFLMYLPIISSISFHLLCRHVTFICGRAGVCALGAVAAKFANDGMLVDHYLEKFKDVMLLHHCFHVGFFPFLCL